MYAIFETGGKQYRASAGDMLTIERLETEAGKPVTFDRVLTVNNDGKVTIGAPAVDQATVAADVVEHKRGPKLIAFKMKRRKGYRRKTGHRQEQTVVKITDISSGGKAQPAKKAAKKKAEPKPEALTEEPAESKE